MIRAFFKKYFGKKEEKIKKVVPDVKSVAAEIMDKLIISVQPHFNVAPVIPLHDIETEYKDLEDKYAQFFYLGKLQKEIVNGEEQSVNIVDVTPSKSDLFFRQAPLITMTMGDKELDQDFFEQTEEIFALEDYNKIPVHQREQSTAELEIQLELEELSLHGYREVHR